MLQGKLSWFLLATVLLILVTTSCGGSSQPQQQQKAAVSLSVTPSTASVVVGLSVQLSASVTNTSNTAVTWAIQEGSTGGSINNSGLYTAPATPGTYHVTVTSQQDPTKSAIITITVMGAVAVVVNPASATIYSGQSQSFSVSVQNATDTTVTWSVQEASGCGTVSNTGVYTPPKATTTCHVVATANADRSKTAVATVTVNLAPNPTFTSTAATSAIEGNAYTYVITATDPANTAINFAVTAGPAGATINGSTLTWTPTRTQSRKSNDFTITATTAAGGIATQSFAVDVPNGTVFGTQITSYGTATGQADVPTDLSAALVAALIPDGAGGYTTISGSGNTAGEFSVPGVPAGNYLLRVNRTFLWTDKSQTDLGTYDQGRTDVVKAATGTNVNFTLNNLAPWLGGDSVYIAVPNARIFTNLTGTPTSDTGATSLVSSELWRGNALLDASKGDEIYLFQSHIVGLSPLSGTAPTSPYPISVLARYSDPIQATLADASTNSVTANMKESATQSTFRLNYAGSEFAALMSAANPNVTPVGSNISYYLLAGDLSQGSQRFITPLVDINGGATNSDLDFGDVSFADPFSQFPHVTDYSYITWVDYKLTTSTGTRTASVFDGVSGETTNTPTAAEPMRPLLGPPTNIQLNGQNFFNSQSGVGTMPTLTWSSPTIGTPTGYRITIHLLQPTVVFGTLWATFYTTDTHLLIPDGLLTIPAPNGYSFRIAAIMHTGYDMTISPYRANLPMAVAPVFSGLIQP